MSGLRLTCRAAAPLRVDMRSISPATLLGNAASVVERMRVGHGNSAVAIAELFVVDTHASDVLVLDGDLSRFDRIGWQMAAGRMIVEGSVGHYAGACMSGGELSIKGSAADLAACEMSGGTLVVDGNVGDFAASTLPGSMDGMRGGTFIVKGSAGSRFADRMRRGTAVVFEDVGAFLASRMVAGTIAIGGSVGAHAAYGMRRGSIVFASSSASAEQIAAATFVDAAANADVFWQLLARDLAKHGGPFEGLAAKRIERKLGDLAVLGKGELIFPR